MSATALARSTRSLTMSKLIEGLNELLVARVLRDYYMEVQETIGLLMCDELTIEEFEESMDNLEYVYANQIMREIND